MNFTLFGASLTQSSLVWVALTCFVFLVLATLGLLFDKRSWREPPHYMLPCRGTLYFAVLCTAGALLVGACILKLKYFL